MVRRCRLSGPHRPRSCGILVASPGCGASMTRACGAYHQAMQQVPAHREHQPWRGGQCECKWMGHSCASSSDAELRHHRRICGTCAPWEE
eukprot:scaffold6689_cov120-Isochrysis_galbana.AAC.3